MKRRNRMRRERFGSTRRKPLGLFAGQERKRKTWTFERLEDRFCFSVDGLDLQSSSLSNSTAEGAAAILQREMQWAYLQAASAGETSLNSWVPLAVPNDPLFGDQWHLLNIGQEVGTPDHQALFGVPGEDINVVPVWNLGYTGEGILVAVLDTGVQITHPDLLDNIHPTLRFNAITGTNIATPNLADPGNAHGTAVAGLIAATWNNLGDPLLDENGDPITDIDGNIVYEGGGTGVAPNATIVPIRLIDIGVTNQAIVDAFQFALENGVDITNNSWGPGAERVISALSPGELDVLRESVLFGRGGLGMINVFASGNSGGPTFAPGFEGFGAYDSANYDPYVQSRYVIAVAGVDHDGLYINDDGTFTSYPEAGTSILVSAPTGSNVAQNVGSDEGQGSGLWTTDLIDDFGYNQEPLPNGSEFDRDFERDPDYTSRFNGTSGAAPIVSGVIALMLEANPNLTFRDVYEILLRSARQNAQFEFPSSGGELESFHNYNTWQTNQMGPFRDPDPWATDAPPDIFFALDDPLADPKLGRGPSTTQLFTFVPYSPATGNDFGRIQGHYEPQPGLFTNDAGYTVSQGYGAYNELIGYGHGTIDAELAVKMALQWHSLGQNIDPFTEKTFTTFVMTGFPSVIAAEKMPNNLGALLVPGGINSPAGAGYIAHWNEYFADPPAPFDPTNVAGWPQNSRGASYVDFVVPVSEQMNIEWVEVKVSLGGPATDLNYLKINITSPNGTQSELNHYYADAAFSPVSTQADGLSFPPALADLGPLNTSDQFVYTFSTNRNWGESTNSAVIIDPVTGEPVRGPEFGNVDKPIFRDWELHLENWSNSHIDISGLEIIWHGKPIEGGQIDANWAEEGWTMPVAQRIQGFVAIDTNGDNEFSGIDDLDTNEWNNRYIQTVDDFDFDPTTIRSSDVKRRLLDDFDDNNNNGVFDAGDVRRQEPFAANVIVSAHPFTVDSVTGLDVVNPVPVAQFLTGADGNYYFDLVPGNYIIRVSDPSNPDRILLRDVETPTLAPPGMDYLPHYLDEWRITADWFFAPDRDNPLSTTLPNNPGEIIYDPVTKAPVPFRFDTAPTNEPPIPMAVRDINFLYKEDAPINSFEVQGTVYSDVDGDGAIDFDDAPAGGITVYHDANRNGQMNSGEARTTTLLADDPVSGLTRGMYSLVIPVIPGSLEGEYDIGVVLPESTWEFTDPGQDGIETVRGGPSQPGDDPKIADFFIHPPDGTTPGPGDTGTIQGIVFADSDKDGVRDVNENGLIGVRVFLDADEDGAWDASERSVITANNGSFFFGDVVPGVVLVDVVIPDEGTANAQYVMTRPNNPPGFIQVQVFAGGSVTGVLFGLENRADRDWGDLPDSFKTTRNSVPEGPSHFVLPGFHLGSGVDGELNGLASFQATGDDATGFGDDGILVISNAGTLRSGVNTLRVTVSGFGGALTGWVDWNDDQTFDESERLIWSLNGEVLGSEADLSPGTFDLQVSGPVGADQTANLRAARFRWGNSGLTFTGPAIVGEVEDYMFGFNFIAGDFNRNGEVDMADYALWRGTQGHSVAIPGDSVEAPFDGADGDGNGIVDANDYNIWRANFGRKLDPAGAGGGGEALFADSQSQSGSGSSTSSQPANIATTGKATGAAPGLPSRGDAQQTQSSSSRPTTVVTESAGRVRDNYSLSDSRLAGIVKSFKSTPTAFTTHSFVAAVSSNGRQAQAESELLLLDQAWADIDSMAFTDVDGSIHDGASGEEEHLCDLALAAVFKEENDWRDEF